MMRQINVNGCDQAGCRWRETPRSFWQEAVGQDVYEDTTYICICGAPLTTYEPPIEDTVVSPVNEVEEVVPPITDDVATNEDATA